MEATAQKGSVGALLKASRERLGIELGPLSETLRIRKSYLQAIEEGRYDDLPGNAYAVGFIRSYGDQLGLDGNDLATRFKDEIGVKSHVVPRTISAPEPIKTSTFPLVPALLGLAIVVGAGYGGWYYMSSKEVDVTIPTIPASLNEKVSDKPLLSSDETEVKKAEPPKVDDPKKVEAPKVEPKKVEVKQPEPKKVEAPKVEPKKVEAPKVEPVKAEETKVEVKKPEPPKVKTEVTPKVAAPKVETLADGKRVYGAENTEARVELIAKEDSWVQVTEGDNLLLTRVLRAGDKFKVPNRPGLKLMTGNAGGLEITVDGTPLSSLGDQGKVRRDVNLEAKSLQSKFGAN